MNEETLRDLFAAAAMAGEVANQSERNGFYKPPFDGLAERCYDMADAMMAEREKRRAE